MSFNLQQRHKSKIMQCPELIKLLEELAPPAAAAAWDNSGIQVIGGKQDIRRVAVALDPSESTIDRALAFQADFVLCHHPLWFEPVFPNKDTPCSRILRKLMQADAWLYSAHTSLDGRPDGPVRWLARELELSAVCLLEPAENSGPYGFGFCGDLPAKREFNDFIALLAAKTGANRVNLCGPRPARVGRVACCPGSGSGLWAAAAALGADLLVTGDVKYHTALETEVCILDVGHFCLEEEMMRRFAADLQMRLAGVEVKFFEAADPIAPYYPKGA